MTAKETAAIEKLNEKVETLTSELHEYHVTVEKHMARCEACRAEVGQIFVDIYGLPGKKESSPGLMDQVSDLRRSRAFMVLAVRAAWVLLTILVGAAATAAFKANL